MKYVLSHLTAIMPKSVVDHVVAVLTNAEEEEDVNFDIRSFQEVGINIPRFEWIDNPFCLVQKLLIRDPSLLEQTRERMTKKIRKSFKAMESVGWLAVPSQKFLELNAKREEIEFHLANNLELLVENERLVGDLLHHAQQIRDGGRAEPLTRQAQHWRLKKEMFGWSKYVCHHPGCHCNCATSNVVSPFASLWCFFNEEQLCETCNHQYSGHRVSRDGWQCGSRWGRLSTRQRSA